MKRSLLTVAVGSVVLVLGACKSTDSTSQPASSQPTSRAMAAPDAAMGMLNDTCPLSGDKVDPNAPTASYAGHTIGFCCGMCQKSWANKSAEDKRAMLAKYMH